MKAKLDLTGSNATITSSGDSISQINLSPAKIALVSALLDLANVTTISNAIFDGFRTNGHINIKNKTTIAHNIDPGELKVLHNGSSKGFILRTTEDPNNRNGLKLIELLSTDGYTSYTLRFPGQSGTVALQSDLAGKADIATVSGKQDKLTHYSEGNNVKNESVVNITADRVTINGEQNSSNTISCTSDGVGATYSGEDIHDVVELNDNGIRMSAIGENAEHATVRLYPDGRIDMKGTVSINGEYEIANVAQAIAELQDRSLKHYKETENGASIKAPGRIEINSGEEKVVTMTILGNDTDAIRLATNAMKAKLDLTGSNATVTGEAIQLDGSASIRLRCFNRSTGSAEINISPTGVSIAGATLDLGTVSKITNARYSGLQTDGDINIKAKTRIAHNIDSGELKVLHALNDNGFILRTVTNPNNTNGLKLVELLSTDGFNSYKYTFPAQSGEVALKAELDALKARVTALEAKHQ